MNSGLVEEIHACSRRWSPAMPLPSPFGCHDEERDGVEFGQNCAYSNEEADTRKVRRNRPPILTMLASA